MSSFVLPTPVGQPQSQTVPLVQETQNIQLDTLSNNFENNDPVTQAVMDNILGKLPTKKPVVVVTCDVCQLDFSGQIVMDMHLAGAKHAKRVKSLEILNQLKTTGETFTRDDKTRILKCDICNIVVNSSQQLQTHLSGNKHKQKTTKLYSQNIIPVIKQPPTVNGKDCGPTGAVLCSCSKSQVLNSEESKRGPPTASLPAGVLVLPEATRAKTKKYYCDTCNVPLNSEVQLEQHLTSRKHKDRLNPKPKRPAPYPFFRKAQPGFFLAGRGRGGKKSPLPYQNPLSNNFVSGGKINYSPEYSPSYPTSYSPGFTNSHFSAPMQY